MATNRVPMSLKVPPALREEMERGAKASGRSLAAEVEHRLEEHALLRRLIDAKLLDIGDDD